MGKKPTKNNKGGNTKKNDDSDLLPFVSICTPTYNRRPFFPMAIQCFNEYDYPKDRMEWIIVDDGTDPIEDLVKDIPQVKYFREEKQMVLGRKRNYMHEKCKGDIIVYQDDDDYYPPDRISHAVEKLMSDPKVMAGGSTVLFLYFKHVQQMYRFGPYSDNHATAGTFAFKRELLKETKYDDFKALAEEKDFLKGYTVPFIQFDPLKSILVFSHNHNTFDKKKLLAHAPNPTCNPDMNITVDHIMQSSSAKKFFLEDIDDILADYAPGDIKNKPEVLNQTALIESMRNQQMAEMNEIRRETMLRKDVQQVQAESQAAVDKMRRDMSRIFEINRQLVHKMKAIKHLLTEEDKKAIEDTDKHPPVVNLVIDKPRLIIKQPENMCNIDPQSVQNIFSFIGQHEVQMDLIINDHERSPASLTCALEFAPHPSQMHKYTNQPQSNQIDLNKALGNQQSANVSEEDVQTIMDQTQCNRATAINALGKEDGDVISCIMNIDSHKCDDVPGQPSANNGSNMPREITIQGVDIDTVMKATGCNETTAIHALANELNNVPNSIQNIKKYVSEDSVQESIYSQEPAKASSDDVETIMDQTECNRATATKALHAENNDVIACIMNIDQYRVDDNKDAKPAEEESVSLEVEE